jgi:hypothetical protein
LEQAVLVVFTVQVIHQTVQIHFLDQLFLMVAEAVVIITHLLKTLEMAVQVAAGAQVVRLLALVQQVKDILQPLKAVEVQDHLVLLVLAAMALHHQLLDLL